MVYPMTKSAVVLLFLRGPTDCSIEVESGALRTLQLIDGRGVITGNRFTAGDGAPARLELSVDSQGSDIGANPTFIRVKNGPRSFTFMLRDVKADYPILIPPYEVAVIPASDPRTYAQILQSITDRKQLTNLQRIAQEPEESYEESIRHTRSLECPIWMGVSRDVRIFEMGLRQPMHVTDYIQPRFHGLAYYNHNVAEEEKQFICKRYGFVAGRGWECTEKTWRHLDEGYLPILHMTREDDDLIYELTAFVTLERQALKMENVRGTHFLVGDGLSACHAFTPEQEKEYQALRDKELKQDEETVLYCRIVGTNRAKVPRYATFKGVHPIEHYGYMNQPKYEVESSTGFHRHPESEKVFAISKIDGRPLPQPEVAVLVEPGGTCVYEFVVPHGPIPRQRAEALAKQDTQVRLAECRAFWTGKLNEAAHFHFPENRIEEMVKAALLQLDLTTYGKKGDGVLIATNGVYAAVSGEIWENIAFYDSMGLHELARRSLQYFLEKQHDNGFMQNFTGYMADTGCVLLGLGLHYRYTGDQHWVRAIAPKVIKACQYLLDWRRRNQRDELRGKGYGLLEGQVADPEDNERIYMLNSYAYAGLRSAAMLLENVDPKLSRQISEDADRFKTDLRTAFFDSLANGPVVPLGDGTWSPTAAPWVGPSGPKCLFLDGKAWYTHGSATVRDDILGPIHLIIRQILDPNEPAATFVLNYSNELMFSRNVASSEPYFFQHPEVHLRRDEAKAFLKSYYSAFTALADRETYSWWEHFWHASPHKTHETAGFLMQTRHMLWMEEGQTLKLLPAVPRAWLESGKRIELKNVGSFFGNLSLSVESDLERGKIEAKVMCDSVRRPQRVTLRLPHPLGQKAVAVEGGQYLPEMETVILDEFQGSATVCLSFPA
jgi:hypothetical protein